MNVRETSEKIESEILSKFASLSRNSVGRRRAEKSCNIRTEYQRDTSRIIHSSAFRRLKHKTQVFIAPKGDHYRTRLTHTLEVSQIARTVARALRLNEDLTEAIALGHDLGHTPFGHAGEEALNNVYPSGFKHYEQSVRVLEYLEKNGRGLNLTVEVLNGILCHTKGEQASTLEGRVVRICDKIAYINHDIEDAVRAGVLKLDNLPSEFIKVIGNKYSKRIDTMVTSLIENSSNGRLGMGELVQNVFDEVHKFMYSAVYLNGEFFKEEEKVPFIINAIYNHFKENSKKMPMYLQTVAQNEGIDRAVCDYIAGMTDVFAIDVFKEISIPRSIQIL